MSESFLPIRVQARAVIVNDLGEVLLLKHVDTVPADPKEPNRLEYWVAPGGGLEPNETLIECAIREAWEETGIDGLCYIRKLMVYEKPLHYNEQLMLMQAHYFLFTCVGRSVLRPNPNENITEVRWWPIGKLKESSEPVLPREFFTSLEEILQKED